MDRRLDAGFDFIANLKSSELSDGRHPIDGDSVYALVQSYTTGQASEPQFEAHRKYIDIHLILSGVENIGWKNRPTCSQRSKDYDPETDGENFTDEPDAWATVHPGAFVIFLPDDTHAPMVGTGEIHKVVVKVVAD